MQGGAAPFTTPHLTPPPHPPTFRPPPMSSSFRRLERLSTWRAVALHAWGRPNDPTVYGVLELDCEPALAYLDKLREISGERVTLTHLVGKAAANAIATRPEINAIVRRGRVYTRDSTDVFFQIAFEGGEDLAGAKIASADKKSIVAIAAELRERAERVRIRKDHETQRTANMMARLPPWMTGFAMRAGETLSYDFGLDLSRLGVPFDAFGSCMVTNISGFGLEAGWAPLLPFSRVPILLTVGGVHEAACVRNGKLEVGKRMKIGVTFDHRLLDGFQAGALAKCFREVFERPEEVLGMG